MRAKKQKEYTGGIVLKELSDILSIDLLHSIANCRRLKIKQLNALISLLIKARYQFHPYSYSGYCKRRSHNFHHHLSESNVS